jgi:hypothetical protein
MEIPRRREIRVLLDRDEYTPGQTVRGHVEVDWPRPRAVRGVRLALVGAEETRISVSRGSGKNRRTVTYTERDEIIAEEIILFGGPAVGDLQAVGEAFRRLVKPLDYPLLPAGRHRYEFDFRLPDDAPPSFEGSHARVAYELSARVDVPLGRDLSFEGLLPVVNPATLRIAPYRARGARPAEGFLRAFRAELGLDLELEGCRLLPGERLEGRLLVRNRSRKRIRGAGISLLGVERAEAAGHEREETFEIAKGYLPAPDPAAESQDILFGIRLEPCPVPYAGRYSRVDLVFAAELDIAMAFDARIEIPLEIEG